MEMLTIQCPTCHRRIRTHNEASYAICVCGNRVQSSIIPQLIVGDSARPHRPSNVWRELHRYAYRNTWDARAAEQWYSQWLTTVPAVGCSCQRHWSELTRNSPPNFASAERFAKWAWFQHNAVRGRLGQPQFSWDDARAAATRPVVGVVAAAYMQFGGTETFHRSLLPRLRKDDRMWIDGFAVSGHWDEGDPAPFDVPWFGRGVDQARILAARCDVLVVWGLTDLETILPTNRPKIIAVHHSDPTSDWSNDTVRLNPGLIDSAVCVHPDVSSELLGVPVTCIPNAVDPARYLGQAAGLRERWHIRPDDHVHFWCHRLANEKQPLMAAKIASRLPDGHVLVMAGEGHIAIPESDKLRYVGRVDSPADWLATASTFLSLATFEGFGLAIAEAMGAGVPVVSTPVGIAAQPGMAIILPFDASVDHWATAMVAAVGSHNAFAQRTIRETYAIEPWVRKWADVILSVVQDY